MIITATVLENLRTMVRGEFGDQLAAIMPKALYQLVSTDVPSTSASNTYGWLEKFPKIRKWIGARVIKDMKEKGYALPNELYEATLGIARTDIEDDNIGVYRTLSRAQADEVVSFMNLSVFGLLSAGFATLCFDGQNFFDTDHPVYPNEDGTGTAANVSNIQGDAAATGKPWFLLSLNGSLKPLIRQTRNPPELEAKMDTSNDHVFTYDEYLYGIRYRGAFGYGFWQQAVACKETLSAANYEAARLKMQTFTRDGGDPLGVVPTHLVVGPSGEAAGRALLESLTLANGASNSNYHTAELIVSPWLA